MDVRNSSIETFRILATFLVLIVHFNGWFVGMPVSFDSSNICLSSVSQALIEGFSVVCVNCFILISGYFGVKLKLKSIWNIWILLVSIYVPFYIAESIISHQFAIGPFLRCFVALDRESYYVQCYLFLIFLSPVLNLFVDKFKHKATSYVLAFALIAFIIDCISGNKCLAFGNGYQMTHFILMYLVGRMLFFNRDSMLKMKRITYVTVYVACSLLIGILYMAGVDWALYYTNPVNIIASSSLFIVFLYKTYSNQFVNSIAKSTFAVYIIHTTPPLTPYLMHIDK